MAVNDHHVMNAWAKFLGAEDKLIFLADGNGEFTRAMGLDDGVVKALNIEEVRGQAVTSGAARILEQIQA